ncbi:MAG: malonyl-ACP O-methyltransferase BioC [Gammaproteobacteria bacterium]
MSEWDALRIDKRGVRASFERAAADYDRVAVLQREVGARLLERLAILRLAPQQILDLGTGTGHIAHAALKRYPGARVLALDIAEGMLAQARRRSGWWRRPRFVCGDIERLPFATHSVDMVLSNLTLQWCNDLAATCAEFRRVLRPGGTLLFTSFGPDTLGELRASWAAVDHYTHVNGFLDMHDVGDALVRAGLIEPVLDVERFTLTYPDVQGLVRDLKTLGAHNLTAGRARGLTGRGRWQGLRDTYETFRVDGQLPATYEVVYGHAWAPGPGTDRPPRAASATVSVPLAALVRPRRDA